MEKVERYFYPAVFTYEPGQEIAVVFPDLDVATSGEDEEAALLAARELLGCAMLGMEEDGEEIPQPTHLTDIKLEKNERSVLIDVYMPTIRMAQVNKSGDILIPMSNRDKWAGFTNSLGMFTGDFMEDGRCQCVTQEKKFTDSRPNLGHKVVSKKK